MAIHSNTPELLKSWLSTEGFSEKASIQLLLGDGSSRSFYRVQEPGSSESWILLSDPEWTQSQDYPAHQTALLKVGLPVPSFKKMDPSQGLLLMQDLGDELLQLRIQKEPSQKEGWLIKATELLGHLHGRLFPVPTDLPVSKRRFDTLKLFQECSFTLEHLREKFLGLAPLKDSERKAIEKFCGALDGFLPLVFCHRDYHCRNLLVHQNGLWMIDFQDARLGPPGYDLASLLFDAYLPISKEVRGQLISVYLKTLGSYPLAGKINLQTFEKELYLLAYQRTLKAAGSFASFWTRFQKNTHLSYIEPALVLARSIESAGLIPNDVTRAFEIDNLIKRLHEKQSN